MGKIRFYRFENGYRYRIAEWVPNKERLKRLRANVQGPRVAHWVRSDDEENQRYVYPSKRYVIKKFRRNNGEVVNIYNTDSTRFLDSDYDDYRMQEDMEKMGHIIQNVRISKKDHADELLKNIYGDPTYSRRWHQKPDPVYD